MIKIKNAKLKKCSEYMYHTYNKNEYELNKGIKGRLLKKNKNKENMKFHVYSFV